VIEKSAATFQAAYQSEVMGRARPLDRHDGEIVFANDRRTVVEFVRFSHLGLEDHPDLMSGAIEAISAEISFGHAFSVSFGSNSEDERTYEVVTCWIVAIRVEQHARVAAEPWISSHNS
jgi:7-keto-8-aminopelargonate synthetase-like enzyme